MNRLEVGRVGRAHGIVGEMAVTLHTNRPERVEPGTVLYVGDRPLVISASRRHKQRWLVTFDGVVDRTAAEALTGEILTADPLGPLPDGELWLHELVGSEVRDTSGVSLGSVTGVDANPAHDILVVDDDLLVPVVFVIEHRDGVVIVDPPEGLVEINRRD
jgi:16S rRNA processing protein RimM